MCGVLLKEAFISILWLSLLILFEAIKHNAAFGVGYCVIISNYYNHLLPFSASFLTKIDHIW